ncbi:MAG: EthD family reductase [Firmicutes bacterium]|nr:EthD family reductase [Bacillota bacterium]
MATLLVLFRRPQDTAAFERHYREVHLPLARKIPGLRSLRVDRTVGGDPALREYHLVSRLEFDSLEALRAALRSPEGQAAGNDLAQFARDGYKILQLEPLPGVDAAP